MSESYEMLLALIRKLEFCSTQAEFATREERDAIATKYVFHPRVQHHFGEPFDAGELLRLLNQMFLGLVYRRMEDQGIASLDLPSDLRERALEEIRIRLPDPLIETVPESYIDCLAITGKFPDYPKTEFEEQAFQAAFGHYALNRIDMRAFADSNDSKQMYATIALGMHLVDLTPPPLTEELVTLDLVCKLLIDIGNMFDWSDQSQLNRRKAQDHFNDIRGFLLAGLWLVDLLNQDPDRWPDVERFVHTESIDSFMNRNYFDVRVEERYLQLLLVGPKVARENHISLLKLFVAVPFVPQH